MIIQLLINSVISGLLLSLVAIGFHLVFNTSRVFHIAHGGIYIAGAYAFYFAQSRMFLTAQFQIIYSLAFALIIVAFLIILIELLIYRPLFKKNSSQSITLISSMAVYILLVNIIALFFSNDIKILKFDWISSFSNSNVFFTPIQIVQITVSSLLLIIFIIFSKSTLYLKIKAVMGNSRVAEVLGVNIFSIRIIVMLISALFACFAAILHMIDTGIDPYSGINITLTAAVAIIIGGNSSILGTIVAALLIAILQTATEWYFSAQWKEGVTFILLILAILLKTEGIVSFKMRVEEK